TLGAGRSRGGRVRRRGRAAAGERQQRDREGEDPEAFHGGEPTRSRPGNLADELLHSLSMSGHSKWASIKHKKAVVDARKGQQFTKLARAITVAAREGGGDPDGNPALALAVQKAREASMPKDNIERAIGKGTGEGIDAERIETVLYEGYGPAGVALLIQTVTDN